MADLTDLDLRIVELRRAGFNKKAIAALVGLTETQLRETIMHPEAEDPAPEVPAVDLSTVESRLAALEAGGGGGEVPSTLVDEVGDHATRIAALEAALNVVPAGHDPIPLTFSANGDTNGLFYWLGTNGGQSAWQNPATAGRLTLTATTEYNDTFAAKNIVGRDDAMYHSQDLPNQAVTFDLGGRRMNVDSYMLRGRTDAPSHMPKTWKLQGSQDGSTWTNLDVHTADGVMMSWQGVGTWFRWTVADETAWRYLRLLQDGLSGDGANFFAFAEAEFYGVLIP